MLEILRERALHIKLEADKQFGGAVDIQSLLKALEAIKNSYDSYLDAELRSMVKGKFTKVAEKELKALKEESSLLVVDLNFASFGAALAPNSVTVSGKYTQIPDAFKAKENVFNSYKEDAFFADHNDPKVIDRIASKFTPEERASIFSPLYRNIFGAKGFTFNVGRTATSLAPVKRKVSEKNLERLMPKAVKGPAAEPEKLVLMYATVEGDPDLFGERKLKIKKTHAVQEMLRDTYPYQPLQVVHGGAKVVFNKPITATVEFVEDEEIYIVTYPDANITAWGDTREEAVEAFNFTFIQTVKTYLNEDNANLTPKAIALKKYLGSIISNAEGI